MSSIQVAVRARPLSQREVDSGSPLCIEMREQATVIHKSGFGLGKSPGRSNATEFVFDHSYWSVDSRDSHYANQEEVFNDLGLPVLQSAFEGYNACVFAYGQTGSGKTYTMMGTETSVGLIPRLCECLFSKMAENTDEHVSYRTEVSYMEIYNEKVRDLLHPEGIKSQHSLRVREHPKEGPYVEDLSKHVVLNYTGISKLIQLGNTHRVTASTKMNDMSSRSHAIFTITFTQATYKCGLPSETVSKIHLVDLAGSERASATGAEGERLKEGGNINRSLVCLGTVISSLADFCSHPGRHKKPYIPYRDSVLTWLLKDSIGGNSKTIMIATISPAESSYGETLSTVRYASRAKNIMNRPTVNEDPNVKLIRDLRSEIQRLKSFIVSSDLEHGKEQKGRLKSTKAMYLAEDIHKKEEQVAELTREWAEKWKDIQRIIKERHIALRTDGAKMVIDSEQPHFVGVDPDILSTGLVFYYLKDGATTIGTRNSSIQPDIVVSGTGIQAEHCMVEYSSGGVVLHPIDGKCHVNHVRIRNSTKLTQGDLLQLGATTVFRFNNPEEALKMRNMHNEGLLPLRKHRKSRTQSCNVTVEVHSRAVVSTGSRATNGAAFTVARPQHGVMPQELGGAPLPDIKSAEMRLVKDVQKWKLWKTGLYYIVLLMCAPILLVVVGTLTFPALSMLILLFITMKVFGMSQHFKLFHWLATLMAVGTSVVVSPVAGLYDVFFQLTFPALASTKILARLKTLQNS